MATREMNAALRDFDVTAPQVEAMHVIAEHGPLSLNDLGSLLIAEGGHPSRLVDRLVSAGWVRRDVARDDRRRITLRLTPAGAQIHKRARKLALPVQRRFADAVEPTDVEAACEALSAYLGGSELGMVVRRRMGGI